MLTLPLNTYQVEEIEQTGPDRYYLLKVNDRPYKIGELVYLILDGLSRQLSYQEIGTLLNTRTATDRYSAQDVATVVEKRLLPMGLFVVPNLTAPRRDALGSIFMRRTLLTFAQYEWVLRLTKWAFSPALFLTVFTLALAANVYLMRELLALDHYVTDYNAQLIANGTCGRGLNYVLFFYPAVLFMLFSHEMGHAAASYRFGVKPKEIGIGVYAIFPVLYTDVTDIWRLNKLKRMIVNLGGLYVQLLLNLVLIGFLASNFGDYDRVNTARYLLQINGAMLVINVIPFLKLDGYWLYSDFFSLPNLHRQASACLQYGASLVLPRYVSRPAASAGNPTNPALIVYTIGRYLFLLNFLWWGLGFIGQQFGAYPILIRAAVADCTLCTVEPLLKATLTLTIFGFTATRFLKPALAWGQRAWQSR